MSFDAGPPLVVVTRPEPPGGPLQAALAACGLTPILAPAFTLEPGGDIPPLADYDWVAWTSAAAVESVVERPGFRAFEEGSAGRAPRHAAVGGATAAALTDRGYPVAIVGEGGSAALAEALVGVVERGARLLHPRSAQADHGFAERLRSFGIEVDDVVAYGVGPVDAAPIRAVLARNPDAVTFASPSAVRGFVAAAGDPADWSADVLLASIGPTTSAALAAALRDPDVEAPEPSFGALAEAVARALREQKPGRAHQRTEQGGAHR